MPAKSSEARKDIQTTPTSPSISFTIATAKVLTPIIYGNPVSELPSEVKEYLKARYGDEKLQHLDFAIPRAEHPITRQLMAYIPGTATYAALKIAAGLAGKPVEIPASIIGIYFPESMVSVKTFFIKKADGKPTLMVAEVINPSASSTGQLLVLGDLPQEFKVPAIQLGKWKKKGFGLIELTWLTK